MVTVDRFLKHSQGILVFERKKSLKRDYTNVDRIYKHHGHENRRVRTQGNLQKKKKKSFILADHHQNLQSTGYMNIYYGHSSFFCTCIYLPSVKIIAVNS